MKMYISSFPNKKLPTQRPVRQGDNSVAASRRCQLSHKKQKSSSLREEEPRQRSMRGHRSAVSRMRVWTSLSRTCISINNTSYTFALVVFHGIVLSMDSEKDEHLKSPVRK